MDEAQRYEEAIQLYAGYSQAAEMALKQVTAARQALVLTDPDNPALKLPIREYAALKGHPILLLAEIFFGGRASLHQKVNPQLALLAGSVALGQGYSVERVLSVLRRLLEHERRAL
ncbi:MAG: hypothetical protein IMW96_11405 [Thermoanaerobacteraceae bacterium]|nr:hypothetical protein [Thermoanaerobacteraceae bacterium]